MGKKRRDIAKKYNDFLLREAKKEEEKRQLRAQKKAEKRSREQLENESGKAVAEEGSMALQNTASGVSVIGSNTTAVTTTSNVVVAAAVDASIISTESERAPKRRR